MVLGILIATITAPGLLGSQEAIRQSQSKEKREEHRARRCNLIATCVKSSGRSRELNGRPVVLRNGRLWIDTGTGDGSPLGHPYAGYYLPYPDSKYEGLVTTITDVAPIMNWVYVDKETHQVRYGVRADAQPNLTGPFDCTRQDRRLTFDGWEGWCAVEEIPGLWALYFDVDDDGLQSKIASDKMVLELELSRKEKRFKKEADMRQQDQTTKRAVNAEEDAPVDQPLGPEALVQRPGVVDAAPETVQADEKPKPAPFTIPKSIFENPPPVLESSIFQRPPTPKTPPPAYSTTVRSVTPTPPDTNSQENTSGSSITPPRKSPSATSVKRTTPKLNRNSGTRALAQAQKFEAMVAAKEPKVELRGRTSQRLSRASSNADSASQYSGDGIEDNGVSQTERKTIPSTSPTPAPLAVGVSKNTAVSQKENITSKSNEKPELNSTAKRPAVPRQASSPAIVADPAVFGAASSANVRRPTQSRRPTISRESSASRTSASRSTSKSSSQSPRPLQRQATAPVRPTYMERPSPRSNTSSNRGSVQYSLAATMSSGRGNQGLKSRVTPSANRERSSPSLPGRAATVREGARATGRKTTSALFREIDELVSQDTSTPAVGGKKRDSPRNTRTVGSK